MEYTFEVTLSINGTHYSFNTEYAMISLNTYIKYITIRVYLSVLDHEQTHRATHKKTNGIQKRFLVMLKSVYQLCMCEKSRWCKTVL